MSIRIRFKVVYIFNKQMRNMADSNMAVLTFACSDNKMTETRKTLSKVQRFFYDCR